MILTTIRYKGVYTENRCSLPKLPHHRYRNAGFDQIRRPERDGVVDINNDRTIIGDPTPKFTGGLNQQFTSGNVGSSLFVNFSFGNDIYNANKIEFTNGYSNNSNMLAIMENSWKTVTATGQTVQSMRRFNAAGGVQGIAPDPSLNALSNKAMLRSGNR